MIDLSLAVSLLRPDLKEMRDYWAQDNGDGKGARLVWNAEGSPPTDAEMEAAIAGYKPRRLLAKYVIVDRLQAAGKLQEAYAELEASDLYTRERWKTRSEIYSDDPTAVALLQKIGVDPAVIMAPIE